MKKSKLFLAVIISMAVALLFAALVIIGASAAYDNELTSDYYGSTGNVPVYSNGTFRYILKNDKATVIGYDGQPSGYISIPSSLGGCPVTVIDSYAFYRDSITGVSIPNTVETIGWYAFEYCEQLESVSIPNSVKYIEEGAFYGCSALANITIGNGITEIAPSAFHNTAYYNNSANWSDGALYISNCLISTKSTLPSDYTVREGTIVLASECFHNSRNNLTSIKLPDSIKQIGPSTFIECSSLKSIDLPDTVTEISYGAFDNCTSLESIEIPDSVKSIRSDAFYNCSALTELTLGGSVTEIGKMAFYKCTALTDVYFGGDVGDWCSIDFEQDYYDYFCYSNPICYGANLYFKGVKATDITIPSGIAEVKSYVFTNCKSITSVTIPSGVTAIGDYAFSGCSSLKTVSFPSGLKTVGSYAFNGCSALTEAKFLNGLISIGEYAFYGCSALSSITLPKTLESTGYHSFNGCDSLISVYYGGDAGDWCQIDFGTHDDDRWGEYYANPLYYAKALYIDGIKATDISIPSGTERINSYAFCNYDALTSVYIPSSVKYIGDYAFGDCGGLISASVGNGVTEIGDRAFYNCTSLSKLKLGSGIERIGNYAFSDCYSIKTVTLPDSVTEIGNDAFYNCYELETINIPYGITEIKFDTFKWCRSLGDITLPETVTEIGSWAFYNAGIYSDYYDEETGSYIYPVLTIPNSVTKIAYDAFEECGFTINCPLGSYADQYAQNYGLPVTYYNKVINVAVTSRPEQTVYAVGSELITTGLKLFVTTDDGNTKTVTEGYTIEPYDFSTAGIKTITVSYGGCSATFNVTVDGSLEPYPQSEHPYANNSDLTWKYTHPTDAEQIVITFSTETATEGGCDFIYIYDISGALVGEFTGNELAGKSVTVNGNYFKIRLVSDESFAKYGFSIVSVVPKVSGLENGDVNGDGMLNASDLTAMRRVILEGGTADANADGKTNIKDLIYIKKCLAGA